MKDILPIAVLPGGKGDHPAVVPNLKYQTFHQFLDKMLIRKGFKSYEEMLADAKLLGFQIEDKTGLKGLIATRH
jgi:hypothetical protein